MEEMFAAVVTRIPGDICEPLTSLESGSASVVCAEVHHTCAQEGCCLQHLVFSLSLSHHFICSFVAVFQPNYLPPMAEQMSQPYVGTAGSYDGNVEVSNEQENYERQLRRMDETNEPMRDRHRDRDRDSDRDRDYSRRRKSGDRLVTNIIC